MSPGEKPIKVIVIGGGGNACLIAHLMEKNPGAEVITLNEAQSRGLVPDEVLFPIENRRSIIPAACFPETYFEQVQKRKSWEPVTYPKNKNKRRR